MTLASINLTAWGSIAKSGRTARKRRERFAACATDVTVVINSRRWKKFRLYYTLDTYRNSFAHLRELGCRVHVMTWVRPDMDGWIEPMADGLAELKERAGFDTVLLDAEGAWSRGFPGRRPRLRADRETAWNDCAALVRMLFTLRNLEYGVTDVPMVSWAVIRSLVMGAKYVMPQCHEFGARLTGWNRPVRLVNWTHQNWPERLPAACDLRPHLAMYGRAQTGAGLRRSIEACIALGYPHIGGWTSRTFAGRGLRRVLAEYKSQIVAAQLAAQEVTCHRSPLSPV